MDLGPSLWTPSRATRRTARAQAPTSSDVTRDCEGETIGLVATGACAGAFHRVACRARTRTCEKEYITCLPPSASPGFRCSRLPGVRGLRPHGALRSRLPHPPGRSLVSALSALSRARASCGCNVLHVPYHEKMARQPDRFTGEPRHTRADSRLRLGLGLHADMETEGDGPSISEHGGSTGARGQLAALVSGSSTQGAVSWTPRSREGNR
jgi:hypothetical protein